MILNFDFVFESKNKQLNAKSEGKGVNINKRHTKSTLKKYLAPLAINLISVALIKISILVPFWQCYLNNRLLVTLII